MIHLNSKYHYFVRMDKDKVELFGLDIACPEMGQAPCSRPNNVILIGVWDEADIIRFDTDPPEASSLLISAGALADKAENMLWCGDDFIHMVEEM